MRQAVLKKQLITVAQAKSAHRAAIGLRGIFAAIGSPDRTGVQAKKAAD